MSRAWSVDWNLCIQKIVKNSIHRVCCQNSLGSGTEKNKLSIKMVLFCKFIHSITFTSKNHIRTTHKSHKGIRSSKHAVLYLQIQWNFIKISFLWIKWGLNYFFRSVLKIMRSSPQTSNQPTSLCTSQMLSQRAQIWAATTSIIFPLFSMLQSNIIWAWLHLLFVCVEVKRFQCLFCTWFEFFEFLNDL